jgi:hypothetical protein
MDYANYWASAVATADLGNEISQSLRFRGTEKLTRTIATDSAGTTSTFSFWIKFTPSANNQYVFSYGGSSYLYYPTATETITAYGGAAADCTWTGKARDFSAWYHIVMQGDGNGDSTNNKMWLNGREISTEFNLRDFPGLTQSGGTFRIGCNASETANQFFDGYLADFICVNGSAVAPTEFGRYNNDGVWVPKNYSGSYGSKGFRLKFDSSAGIGDDSSGNGNDFTASGFDTTAISSSNTDNDVDYLDTPTSNYGTWNPIHTAEGNKGAFTDANLQTANNSGGDYIAPSTIACGDGHWYWEVRVDGVQTTGYPMIGIFDYESAKPEWGGGTSNTEGCLYWTTGQFGAFVTQGSESSYGATFTTGDIIGVEYNGSNGQLTFYKNGTSQGLATTVAASRRNNMIPGVSAGNDGSAEVSVNFGQMDFIYTVPTGAEKLQTNNLTESTIKNGKDHFDTVTYTGSSSAKTVTGLEFQPDLIWFKSTSHSTSHALFDSVRGTSAGYLMSDDGGAEETSNGTLTSFNSDGFTTGVPVSNEYNNGSGRNYVAWCWKAGGAAVSNGNGSITSSVSANTDAGFSIVSYTGTGSAATIGHGLNSPPECILVKNRDSSADWAVYHVGLDATAPEDKYIVLNTDAAVVDAVDRWNDTAPTSTVFTVGNALQTNGADDMIAYCWHSVEGYSKFGKYAGNDNADGPFVYTGFRPAMIILKSIGLGYDWFIWDTTRDTSNPSDTTLKPDLTQDETTASSPTQTIDILSNGFKIRDNRQNNQLTDYLYCAWAENPFGGENVPPATAR